MGFYAVYDIPLPQKTITGSSVLDSTQNLRQLFNTGKLYVAP